MPIKQNVAQSCTGHWKVGMFEAPGAAPAQFLYGCLCPCCASFQQRNELLDITGEPYVCCAGAIPCCGIDKPQDDRTCLYLEVCCCPGLAISGNRFMVQTRFDKENTACDDCILWTTCLCVYGLEFARCFGVDIPEELDCLVDCLVLTVNGCMHAQQHIEIEEIKKTGYGGPPQAVLAGMPPAQQQMIQMGKIHGGGGVTTGVPVAAPPVAATPAPQAGSAVSGSKPAPVPAKPQQQVMDEDNNNVEDNNVGAAPASAAAPVTAAPVATGTVTGTPAPAPPPAAPIQVQCGSCQKLFGSPSYGVTIACPFCGAHNQVPVVSGTVVSPAAPASYGGGQQHHHGGHHQHHGGSGRPGGLGGGALAAGALGVGAGVLGAMAMGDILS